MAVSNKDVLNKLNDNMSNLRSGLYGVLTTKISTNEAEEAAKNKVASKER